MAPAAMPTAKPIMKPILTLSKQLGCVCPYGPTVTGILKMDADFIFWHHAILYLYFTYVNYVKIYIMTLFCVFIYYDFIVDISIYNIFAYLVRSESVNI